MTSLSIPTFNCVMIIAKACNNPFASRSAFLVYFLVGSRLRKLENMVLVCRCCAAGEGCAQRHFHLAKLPVPLNKCVNKKGLIH